MLVGSRALDQDHVPSERVALVGTGGAMTYGDLREAAATVGARSAGWPVTDEGRGPDIALLADWTPDMMACFMGLAMAGWAVGVLDPASAPAERAGALAQLSSGAAIVTADLVALVEPFGWHEIDRVACGGTEWVVLSADEGAAGGAQPCAPPSPDADFYVGFTSGSDGAPKAFARSHRSWWESFVGLDARAPLPPGPVVVPGPLSSSHFLFGALHGLHAGATVELARADEVTPHRIAARAAAEPRPGAMYVVPTMLVRLVAGSAAPAPGPRSVYCAGARLEPAVRETLAAVLPETAVVEYYGASELSFVALRTSGDGAPTGSVGRAFPGVAISIRDDDGAELPDGETGRIFVRSRLIFTGYRGAVRVAGAESTADGWWTVGDRGHVDSGGHLFVGGRGTSLIISGGVNVQPEEVEGVLGALASVAECAVVGVPDPVWGETIVAVVVPGHPTPTRADLRRAAADLGAAKRPRRYVAVDGPLPTLRAGKLDRAAIRAAVLAGAVREIA